MDFHALDDAALLELIALYRSDDFMRQESPHRNEAAIRSEAISVLYDRYGRLVFTVAYHVIGDSETAEEITQDVFVKIWENAGSYRSDLAKVSSWLVSITRNRSIDELRRRAARPANEETGFAQEIFTDLSLQEDPKETAETHLQVQRVRQVMATLPSDQKQVLGLAYFKGYSQSEIAGLLGEPLGTVKSRLRLAMQKLRSMLIDQGVLSD